MLNELNKFPPQHLEMECFHLLPPGGVGGDLILLVPQGLCCLHLLQAIVLELMELLMVGTANGLISIHELARGICLLLRHCWRDGGKLSWKIMVMVCFGRTDIDFIRMCNKVGAYKLGYWLWS